VRLVFTPLGGVSVYAAWRTPNRMEQGKR